MKGKYLLGIDQGTTNTKAVLVDASARIAAVSQSIPVPSTSSIPGRVEVDPRDLLRSIEDAVRSVLASTSAKPTDIACAGLANQGETVIPFDTASGEPLYPAISWQDKRNTELAVSLEKAGESKRISDLTGLRPNAYFSAFKMRWILDHVSDAAELVTAGRLCLATSDTWLLNRLLQERPVLTDIATASRTMLLNLEELTWDGQMLALMGLPHTAMPRLSANANDMGCMDAALCGGQISVGAACVDQQAALFGQRCLKPGSAKLTYGTGCFLLINVGGTGNIRADGLLSSVGWVVDEGTIYVIDGGIHSGGDVVNWLIHKLQLADSLSELDSLMAGYRCRSEVYFLPALRGLAAPYWISDAKGSWCGLDASTDRIDLLFSAQEAIAFRVREIVEAAENAGVEIPYLQVDGGLTRSRHLMQLQANVLDRPILIFGAVEATAYGVALMAGLSASWWSADTVPERDTDPVRIAPDREGVIRESVRFEKWKTHMKRYVSEKTV